MADLRKILRKRRKSVPTLESSSSDEDLQVTKPKQKSVETSHSTPAPAQRTVTQRSSERIRKKQSQEFHLPTKKELWDKITPTKSPGKYQHLKPRKLVNNFTKENNRYNYDPFETSGEESIEDFIDDDEEEEDYDDDDDSDDAGSSSKQNDKEEVKHKTSSRIKGRHQRIWSGSDRDDSSSSSCEQKNGRKTFDSHISRDSAVYDMDTPSDSSECSDGSRTRQRLSSSCKEKQSSIPKDSYKKSFNTRNRSNCKVHIRKSVIESDSAHNSDDSQKAVEVRNKPPGKAAKEKNDVESGAESSADDELVTASKRIKHNRSIIESDDDSELIACSNIADNTSGPPPSEGCQEIERGHKEGKIKQNLFKALEDVKPDLEQRKTPRIGDSGQSCVIDITIKKELEDSEYSTVRGDSEYIPSNIKREPFETAESEILSDSSLHLNPSRKEAWCSVKVEPGTSRVGDTAGPKENVDTKFLCGKVETDTCMFERVDSENQTVVWDGNAIVLKNNNLTGGDNENEIVSDFSDWDEIGEESTSDSDSEIDDDDENISCRMRVGMLKKKQKREKLMDRFRKERERKLSKQK